MSSNSVASVTKLVRGHGSELLGEVMLAELLSSAESAEGEDGRTGADKKWKPRGVGK